MWILWIPVSCDVSDSQANNPKSEQFLYFIPWEFQSLNRAYIWPHQNIYIEKWKYQMKTNVLQGQG